MPIEPTSANTDKHVNAPERAAEALTGGRRWSLAYWTIFVCLSALGIAPVWVSDLLPVLDAASHLHLMRIIHEYGDNLLYQHHYAEVNAIVPYLTYYKAVDWLQFVTDVEQANRLVLSVCLLGVPLGVHAYLRAIGHNRWLVLGVFPWMLNSDFFMGFFNYLMSIPVFLFVLAAHVRFLRKPNLRQGALVASLLIFLAVTHYLLWGVSLALLPLLAFALGSKRGWLRGAAWGVRDIGLVVPSILVLMPWFLSYFVFADGVKTPDQAVLHGSTWIQRLLRIYSGQHLTPLDSITQIFERLFNRFAEQPAHIRGVADLIFRRHGELISSIWLIGLALWFVGTVKRRQQRPQQPEPAAEPRNEFSLGEASTIFLRDIRGGDNHIDGTSYATWALGLVTLAYFILPQHLSRPIILYGVNFRLVEVLGLLAITALPVSPLVPRPHVRWQVWFGSLAMLVAGVMMPLYTAGVFMLARTEYGSIRDAYGVIPANRSVLTLRMKRESRWLKEKVFSNIGEYYAVFRDGYVPYSFADSSSKPIVTQTEASIPGPIWYDHGTFRMKAHGQYFDYVVIYRGLNERTGSWERKLKRWHKIYHRDRWQVYRNPDKQRWPPLTPKQQALNEAVDHAIGVHLELIGLHRMQRSALSVQDLLKLWNPELKARIKELKKAGPKGRKTKRKKRRRQRPRGDKKRSEEVKSKPSRAINKRAFAEPAVLQIGTPLPTVTAVLTSRKVPEMPPTSKATTLSPWWQLPSLDDSGAQSKAATKAKGP